MQQGSSTAAGQLDKANEACADSVHAVAYLNLVTHCSTVPLSCFAGSSSGFMRRVQALTYQSASTYAGSTAHTAAHFWIACCMPQVGACIVNQDQVIVGIGYNGFPRGCADTALPWAKKSRTGNVLETKYPYVSAGR